jgi:hypothetical protein
MKVKTKLIALILAMGLLTVGQACAQTESNAKKPNIATNLTSTEIQEIIKDSVSWFSAAQTSKGRFNYEYMPYWDRYVSDDNIVRQSGAFYVLGEIMSHDKNNKYSVQLKEMMEKAMVYFKEQTISGEFNGKKFNCVVKTENKCTLGTSALVLTGMVNLIQEYPELNKDYGSLADGYAQYIVAMKMEEKGFRGNFNADNDEQSDSESPFYNGEGFLALVRYNEYKPSTEIGIVIEDAFAYFDDLYTKSPDNDFYLWGMAAIKNLYAKNPDEKYFNFVKKYTDWRIKQYKQKRVSGHNYAAYIEGVVSAYSVLKDSVTKEENSVYLEEINFWLKRTSQLQVKRTTQLTVKFNDSNDSYHLKLKNEKKAVGGFLTGYNEPFQRIDFTQHAVNAYLQKLVDIDGDSL